MATVARLKQGDLLLAGEINERLPAVTNGLIANYPLDGTIKGTVDNNILDYSTWIVGKSGSQTGFNQNGDGNSVILDEDPWGNIVPVWRSLNNDVDSNADGGWNSTRFPIDNTKLYRYSVWIKRKVLGNGMFYFGAYAYGSVNGLQYNTGTTVSTNPYFHSGSWSLPIDEWILLVAHIHPYDHTSTSNHPDSGIWDLNGKKLGNIARDLRWLPETATATHRTYLYYSTIPETDQRWCHPRVDVCDGTEPSLEDLLIGMNGNGAAQNPFKVRYIRDYINGSTANTSNHWCEIQALTHSGTNVALGKSGTSSTGAWNSLLTDGSTASNPYWGITAGEQWVQIDLERPYDIKEIKVWHYYADARTYRNSKTQVSQDGTTWYTVFDSRIDGEYKETSEGKTHVVDPNRFYTYSLGDDGLAIESETVNIAPNTDFSNKNYEVKYNATSWGGDAAEVYYYPEGGYNNLPYKKMIKTASGSGGSYIDEFNSFDIVEGKTYTISCYLKANKPVAVNRYVLAINRSSDNYYITGGGDINLTTEWVKHSWTLTGTASNAGTYKNRSIIYNDAELPLAVYWCGFQIEEKDVSTSYTSSIRENGSFVIPLNLGISNFTVTGEFIPNSNSDNIANGSWFLRFNQESRYVISTYNNQPFLNGNAITGLSSQNVHIDFNTMPGVLVKYIITRNGQTFSWRMITADGQDKTWTKTHTNVGSYDFKNVELGYSWGGVHRNIRAYNRILSADEINKILGSNLSLTSSGNILQTNIKERSIVLPNSMYYYFPLDDSSSELSNIAKASEETNIIYEDGAWVGSSTTNEFAYPDFNTSSSSGGWKHWGSAGHIGTYGQNTDPLYIFDKSKQYSHWVANAAEATSSYLLYQSPAFEGGYRSLQAIICMDDLSEVTDAKVYPAWNARNGGIPLSKWTSIKRIDGTHFYHCKAEGISQDGSNDLVGIYVKPGYKIYVSAMQLEQKPFCSPIAFPSRGSSSLEFNFNRDLGLDWASNWTIIYWKKPVGTSNNLLTGYNIESLGCNGNSVGGGYRWIGKNSGSNIIYGSSPSDFVPEQYFNKWHMVSLVKIGSTITAKTWGVNSLVSTRTISSTTTVSNYYVTQYGYDFKLGGHDNNNPPNTYYRDLIVVKEALSDAIIENIYKKQMSLKGNIIYLQNNIKEGVIL